MRNATVFLSGLIFSVGLVIAGMTQPSKVVGFLDFFGDWDPSLAFVMGGALLVHAVGYLSIKRRAAPILADYFRIPTRNDINARLIVGAALFGVGWGLAGYCPGPAIASVTTLRPSVFVFVASMVAGMMLFTVVDKMLTTRASRPSAGGKNGDSEKPSDLGGGVRGAT